MDVTKIIKRTILETTIQKMAGFGEQQFTNQAAVFPKKWIQ